MGSILWGRIDRGWICISGYVDLETVTENPGQEPETPDEPEIPDEPEVPDAPTPVTKTYGTVTNAYLRIRAGAGTGYASLGQLKLGDRVEILETKVVGGVTWGRFEGGWICLTGYVKLETVTENPGQEPETPDEPETPGEPEIPDEPQPATKTYATITATALNVRTGAGTQYTAVGRLTAGNRVEILETKTVGNTLWGRYSSGWFCITGYATLETVTENDQPQQRFGTVTADLLNVRADAGIGCKIVCQLIYGTQVEILETKVVNGTTWAHIRQGWVSMTYIAE